MTFISIQEPDRVLRPSVTEAVGIDFGTTYSAIALCDNPQQPPRLIGPLIPSTVSYASDATPLVGQAAGSPLTISSIKRWLDQDAQTASSDPRFGGRSPFQVTVDIFNGLKDHMLTHEGRWIPHAVLTVPAYFDEWRRQCIKQAACAAGWNIIRLISEPTAAALCHQHHEEGFYAVYDLGGGTFDFSILKMHQGLFRVLATGGHHHLGGDDFDSAIAHHLFCGDPQGLSKARHLKESTKSLRSVLTDNQWPSTLDTLMEETLRVCSRTLADANLSVDALKDVFVVGGSTHCDFVWDALVGFFGRSPSRLATPETAVVHGAAMYAHHLIHKTPFLLLDVTPLSLGIDTMGGVKETLIPRNSPLPACAESVFTTQVDGQTAMTIHVVQGEQEMTCHNHSLGTFQITHLPPLPRGRVRVPIQFQLDTDGLLTVTARPEDGQPVNYVVNAMQRIHDQHIVQEVANQSTDIMERLWQQQCNKARMALTDISRVLQDQPDADVTKACQDLALAMDGQCLTNLKHHWESFEKVVVPFME